MMINKDMLAVGIAGSIVAGVAMGFAMPQSGVPAAGGQPSAAPRPANSQPRPTGPASTVPGPGQPVQPATTQPATTQPAGTQPATTQPAATTPAGTVVVNPGVQPGQVDTGVQPAVVNPIDGRYIRPFAFQTPGYEARFTDYSRRLVTMEQRLVRTNAELTKKLGEARALTGERQMAATFDILQQMLKEQAAVNAYLVRARTAWSGEMEGSELPQDEMWTTGQATNQQPTGNVPNGNVIEQPIGKAPPQPR